VAERAAKPLREKSKRMVIVAIEGKGCSGKSLLAGRIAGRVSCLGEASAVASLDDFCNPRATRYSDGNEEGLQVYHQNFDERLWEDEVLRPACRNGRLQFERDLLDARTDTYSNRVSVDLPQGGVLITEGLHVLKKVFRRYFDLALYLHISDELQLERALRRDREERGKSEAEIRYKYKRRFVPSYEHFLKRDCPFEVADLVVDMSTPDRPILLSGEKAKKVSCG